jgi:hypothetical protein
MRFENLDGFSSDKLTIDNPESGQLTMIRYEV